MPTISSWAEPREVPWSNSALAKMPCSGERSSWLTEEIKSNFDFSVLAQWSRQISEMMESPKNLK
jgi:hypothetical protein